MSLQRKQKTILNRFFFPKVALLTFDGFPNCFWYKVYSPNDDHQYSSVEYSHVEMSDGGIGTAAIILTHRTKIK